MERKVAAMSDFTIEKTLDVEVNFNCGEYVETSEAECDDGINLTIILENTLEGFLDDQAQETHGCDWADLVNKKEEE